MKHVMLFLTVLILFLSNAAGEGIVQRPDVFWQNVQFNDAPVDFSVPLPDCRNGASDLCNPDIPDSHEECWKAFWYSSNATLSWHEIEFSAAVKPPNYDEWVHWDCHYTDVWGDYFNEMYYEGGAANPLADEKYDPFWRGLRLDGAPVDPYSAPPNYDAALDYYAGQRSEIGYHWYWEYHFSDLQGERADAGSVLEWNGTAIDVSTQPGNVSDSQAAYDYNRLQRGFLEHWAKQIMSMDEFA